MSENIILCFKCNGLGYHNVRVNANEDEPTECRFCKGSGRLIEMRTPITYKPYVGKEELK